MADFLVLDTEATDKYPDTAEVLSVAIIDHTGAVLLDTLVRPVRTKTWPRAQEIHGIAPKQVLRPEVPTLADLNQQIADLLRGREVVIYNASYDATILAEAFALGEPAAVHCAMLGFSEHPEVRVWNSYHGNYRWQSLATAADHVGHQWRGRAHGALADCYAARDVWAWLTDPAERARLEAAKVERREAKELARHVREVFAPLEQAEADRLQAVNQAWERAHYPIMGLSRYHAMGWAVSEFSAEKSADAFLLHLEGTTARAWNRYGEKLLRLPRYYELADLPSGCIKAGEVHLLPAAERLTPIGLLVQGSVGSAPQEWLGAARLFSKRQLRKGVHYVPISPGYDAWPEGHYSKTTLHKQFKLKLSDIEKMKPGYLRVVKRGSSYENEYLLYPYTPQPNEKPS